MLIRFRNELDIAEMEDSTIFVAKNFIQILEDTGNEDEVFDELILECIKHLKIMCTKGSTFQNLIVNTNGMIKALNSVISSNYPKVSHDLELKCFQLIANLCVKNEWSQRKIWASMSNAVVSKFEGADKSFVNVSAMIVYNMILSKEPQLDKQQIVRISLHHYSVFLKTPSEGFPDFVSILMDFVICKDSDVLDVYKHLDPEDQKVFLFYIHDHVENYSNE